jgi:hypothetical protein
LVSENDKKIYDDLINKENKLEQDSKIWTSRFLISGLLLLIIMIILINLNISETLFGSIFIPVFIISTYSAWKFFISMGLNKKDREELKIVKVRIINTQSKI